MKKVAVLIVILSVAIGTLFYLSNISFQLGAFDVQHWLVEVLFMLFIGALSGFVVMRHGKRWNKKSHKE
ncbi:hypothetical protein [Nonlabens sp.]|uniref:hypothetical protein n=1 Tax=Nonlabens sp. TaxID=1888209 RepID=UPI003F69A08E